MNSLAVGEQGAFLVATMTMMERKTNAPTLARLWEQVTREIELKCINAICTDNAEVNRKATQILEWRKDKEVAKIPWFPCGPQCCNFLLKDLTNLSWIKGIVKTANTNDSGYIDVLGSFFEPLMEPEKNDGSVLSGPAEDAAKKEEEEERRRRMVKAPRARIPKDLVDFDSSGISKLEDLVWKGKCWNESSSEDCSEEEAGDANFELLEAPTVPTTTYVGTRTQGRERDLKVETTPVVNTADMGVGFLLHPHDDPNEEEATRAKAMVDKDAELADRRMRAEEARRAALPTPRERERHSAQLDKNIDETVKDVDKEDGEKNVMHEEENVVQQGGDKGQRADEPSTHQKMGVLNPAMEKSGQQQEEASEAAREQPAGGVVDKRRPCPHARQQVGVEEQNTGQQATMSEQQEQLEEQQAAEEIGTPPFPAENEALQHDNLLKNRAGRKRKPPLEESPTAPGATPEGPKRKDSYKIPEAPWTPQGIGSQEGCR
ncbi:hypothetical protein CBR_g4287 [Chara braunii]|uniref:DUF659 domain-containing protein n=1 Tax=Chara braunii TaxID=69332 RepID=A0A388JRB7_CHABU|nr:hypothetical protein CBR_g4287 [Chara braunii]|eukprot:GBG60331.1 hypothetical protein CBR_g4287 [Chara braunii]